MTFGLEKDFLDTTKVDHSLKTKLVTGFDQKKKNFARENTRKRIKREEQTKTNIKSYI